MTTTRDLSPIRKAVSVDAPPESAFETFTARVASWWPTQTHSIFETEVADVVLEGSVGGRLYERSVDGAEADWADVLVWEPPHRIVLRWRVNPERSPTEVEVRFRAEGTGTRVELEHRGWERTADSDGHASYVAGWGVLLDRYADRVASGAAGLR